MDLFTIAVIIAVIAVAFGLILVAAISKAKPKASKGEEDSYTRTPLLNKSEVKVLEALDDAVMSVFGAHARVFPQVSYGEFLKGNSRSAYAKVSQKRADFVIAMPADKVVCVVEYQGSGHYGRSDASRKRAEESDQKKRAALSSAEIPLVEVPAKFTSASVRALLEATKSASYQSM